MVVILALGAELRLGLAAAGDADAGDADASCVCLLPGFGALVGLFAELLAGLFVELFAELFGPVFRAGLAGALVADFWLAAELRVVGC